MGLEEKGNHGDEQQCIAGVGDTDAPRIVVIRENDALQVAVVIGLTEPEAVVFEWLVHADRSTINHNL